MGQEMVKIFEAIRSEDGMRGQMRLSMKTGITVSTAKSTSDSPEDLGKLIVAFKEITGKEYPVEM